MRCLKSLLAGAGAAAAFLVFWCAVSSAQTVPRFSHGPTASMFSVRFDRSVEGVTDARFGMLSEGLGYSFNLNGLAMSPDGSLSYVGIKFPVYPQISSGEFTMSLGAEVSFFNSLFGIGAALDLIDTAEDRGAILGEVDARDVMVTFSLGFNVGSGAAPTGAAKALAQPRRPPFNFVSFTR